jgi:hypothetical protein
MMAARGNFAGAAGNLALTIVPGAWEQLRRSGSAAIDAASGMLRNVEDFIQRPRQSDWVLEGAGGHGNITRRADDLNSPWILQFSSNTPFGGGSLSTFSNVEFRGLIQNRLISELNYNEIRTALIDAGLSPTHHFVERIMDPRTSRYGVNTFSDLQRILNYGVIEEVNDGLQAIIRGRLAIIFDPNTGNLVTLRPWE